MNLLLAGATGFIGTHLLAQLTRVGHTCHLVSRKTIDTISQSLLETIDAVINLAGEPVIGKRWTDAQRTRIRDSRVRTTTALANAIAQCMRPPKLFINASGVGYYGSACGENFVNESSPRGDDFLAAVCHDWETAAFAAHRSGTRVVCLRLGVVLGKNGGMLARTLPIFRFGLGGRFGNGQHWMSWIHIDDVCGLIEFFLTCDRAAGPINTVAPAPVTNAEFTRTLARLLHRPAWCHVPRWILSLALGAQSCALTASQRVMPERAQELGYVFRYATLEAALLDCTVRDPL